MAKRWVENFSDDDGPFSDSIFTASKKAKISPKKRSVSATNFGIKNLKSSVFNRSKNKMKSLPQLSGNMKLKLDCGNKLELNQGQMMPEKLRGINDQNFDIEYTSSDSDMEVETTSSSIIESTPGISALVSMVPKEKSSMEILDQKWNRGNF